MEVTATHVERCGDRPLVCELYPGVLVVDGGGIETMLLVSTGVEPLPSDVNPTFTTPGAQTQSAADRFGDMVDFAALSRYFDVPRRHAPGVLPRDAGVRPTWAARVIDGRPALEVRATHITTGRTSEKLVCELYPGILAMEGFAVYTVLTMGNAVEPLPIDSDERFAMRSGQAVSAALQYAKQMSRTARTWPPPQWGLDLRRG